MTNDDSMSDDVFEESDAERSVKKMHRNGPTNGHALAVARDAMAAEHTPSPTGYPGYKPSAEALRMYAYDSDGEYFHPAANVDKKRPAAGTASEPSYKEGVVGGGDDSDTGDGWKSYTIEDDSGFDENIIHKVCCTCVFSRDYLKTLDLKMPNYILR